jgi:3-phenylpropionate/trans-cinnamate dioxygenase ferredoxin reductase subunit
LNGAPEPGILIVGGGPAAQAAAGAYRDAGGGGPVTIAAAEAELPYERPPLTKEYLRGESGRGDLLLEHADWYREREVEVVLDCAVAELDLDAGIGRAEDGRRFEFERCLLATGARPLVPEIPGAEGPDVRVVRTIADSEQLRGMAEMRVLVVGSGFIGCEAAASLAMLGAEVKMATLEPSPQTERLGVGVAGRIRAWLDELGVELLAGVSLVEVAAERSGALARFADSRTEAVDAVVLALGVTRNDELAAGAGLEVDDGVPVDASMVSAHPRLLAAGDVARAENAAAGRRLVVEHWGEALNQGAVAGRTLAGEEGSWAAAPGFWSTIGKRTIKYAGWGDGWDEVRLETGAGESFTAWYGRNDELVGVLACERDANYEEGRRRIEERAPWS